MTQYKIEESEFDGLVQLIDDLRSDEDCWYDHHGYCQAHYWFDDETVCPHKRAKKYIERVKG